MYPAPGTMPADGTHVVHCSAAHGVCRIRYFAAAPLPSTSRNAAINRSTFCGRAVWPIRPIRQTLPASGPRPPPISMSCFSSSVFADGRLVQARRAGGRR